MKKLLAILLVMTLVLSMASCSKSQSKDNSTQETDIAVEDLESVADEIEASVDDATESLGEIEVDEGLLEVTITIPADIIGETTQEEVNAENADGEYKSATLNDDGSVTYVMSKKQHNKMMDEMTLNLNESLQDMVDSEDFPTITDIQVNKDYTEFNVTTTSTELNMMESFSILGFYYMGGMYNQFNATPVDNIVVNYINADSGEIIETGNSKNMGDAE